MGDVIPFPKSKQKPTRHIRLVKAGVHWRMGDLRGSSPLRHPVVLRGKRGRVILGRGQVWVERHTDHLWVLKKIVRVREAFYPHDVVLFRYESKSIEMREIAESTMRMCFEVWDDVAASRKVIMGKLASVGASPSFFGLDNNGNRID